jgi:hypothetical protein
MTPGNTLFSEWWYADGACAPKSQLRATFRNIQKYLRMILPFVGCYLIACAILTLRQSKKGLKKGQVSILESLIILVIIALDMFVLLIWQASGGFH